MTPESQGGVFESQFELQQSSANQLTADVSQADVKDGVNYQVVNRTGFLLSTSLVEQLDLFWTHTGGGNSLLGVKYQFLGGSRISKSAGHKMALSFAIGGNEHETSGADTVEFELQGQEAQLLYGFRFSEIVMAYTNLSYGRYLFDGEIKSSTASIDGLKPAYETKSTALYGGLELNLAVFFAKLECGYQQLKTTYTNDETAFFYGYSFGMSW